MRRRRRQAAQSRTMALRGRAAAALLVLLFHQNYGYEKTLRKIVRDQSKMVQKPFSVSGVGDMVWKNMTHGFRSDPVSLAHSKKVLRRSHGPKSSLSAGDMSKATFSIMHFGNKELVTNDRLVRAENVTTMSDNSLYSKHYDVGDGGFSDADAHDGYFNAPKGTDNIADDQGVVKPKNDSSSSISKLLDRGSIRVQAQQVVRAVARPMDEAEDVELTAGGGGGGGGAARYSYNKSVMPHSCVELREVNADIDVQEKFSLLNIEPPWCHRKTYWNRMFDDRYESLMLDPRWPPLQVILIPRTHVDTIWKRTFEQYHDDSVHKILSNVVKKLQFYPNLTFSWNEVSHLSRWWATTTQKNRAAFRRLVKAGRLEITTGFWVEPDEATTHIFELVHQLIEGHQWLKQNLNMLPKVGWLTNSVAHSPTVPYLLSACGVPYLVFTNLHFALEKFFAEYRYSDFIWLQNWDEDEATPASALSDRLNRLGAERLPRSAALTHYLQFNAAGFRACGPNRTLCLAEFNFARTNTKLDVHTYNEKDKAELLLEQYSKTGTITPHNVVIAPVGGPYRYETQAEFDYQYNNYQRLADYINSRSDIYKTSIKFGTAQNYFDTILNSHKKYPTLKGDFLNFADLEDGRPAYWTGYFTTRPLLKLLLRRLHATLRTTEMLFSFALTYNAFEGGNVTHVMEVLERARAAAARLADRHVAGGTLPVAALRYVHTLIVNSVKDCWYIQEVAASLLTAKPGNKAPYLQKYVYRDGEFISGFRSVIPGDQLFVFNSLSHERTEIVELITKHPNIRIVDHNKKDVTLQLNPTWKYGPENIIEISNRYFKAVFGIVVPPMTLELYRVAATLDASLAAAAVYCSACRLPAAPQGHGPPEPFAIHPVEPGDIQIESYKYRLIFDEATGFMKTVVEKETNIENTVIIDYGAFRSSDRSSGMFLFKTNSSRPLYDNFLKKSKIVMIVSGQVTTELTAVHGRLLQHTAKIYNLMNCPLSSAIYVESRVDYEASPKNREMEMFLSIQTDISNGSPPEIVTDNNGFQYTHRVLNLSRGVESNLYPVSSVVFIEDRATRLSVASEHAGGAGALQEGQLLLALERRVLYNDARGAGEGLADTRPTTHRHYILLENFHSPEHRTHASAQKELLLPSLTALQLSSALTNPLDLFIVDKNGTHLPYFAFFPLVNVPFPCDVAVLNFRAMLRNGAQRGMSPNTALLVLHRQSFACGIRNIALHCDGEVKFNIEKNLRNIKSVYKTNLSGTSKGNVVSKINQVNFPAMELATFRLHF